jgi:hypothetical protein
MEPRHCRDEKQERRKTNRRKRDKSRRAVDRPPFADEKHEPQHEQEVAHHRTGKRRADDIRQAVREGDERNDQLRGIAEAGVQKAADSRPGVVRCLLGRLPDEPRERNQGERGEGKQRELACGS